jgi:multidrug efflux pump subunit AcrB
MLFYYKLAGLNALTSIVVNLVLLLGMMAYLGATMTLPGIAGFILTIGMGVDSNVLIFERIKEELATARGVRAAVNAGFDRVWWTIVDTHVASDRGRVPVPVRHRADSRVRHESGHRARVQRLHGGLRVADHVRNRADPPPRCNPEYLSVRLCEF